MANLKNHPAFELRDDAAAAFDAYENAYGVIGVNSAKRTEAAQQELINRWERGGVYNRPPYLYQPARPAKTSPHVKDGGIAVDTSDWQKFKRHCTEFGFVWYGASDVVHFEFKGLAKVPEYPLKSGYYFGPQSGPVNSVSGYHGNGEGLETWQVRMKERGWAITPDGLYGNETARIAKAFQREKGLYADGLIGPATWAAAWTSPVT